MEENIDLIGIPTDLGIVFNEEENIEIITKYRIFFDKKSVKYCIESNYEIITQFLGTFLSDFLNTDFNIYDEFEAFFFKYPLVIQDYKKIFNTFKNNHCEKEIFENFIKTLYTKNKLKFLKLQEQTDMIIDYCLINPVKNASKATPLERLFVLSRISPTFDILHDNKAEYYTLNLFSGDAGNSEKEMYDFLSKKNNTVKDYNLIIPHSINSIIYKSLLCICKESVYLKSCKLCNKYFIAPNNSIDYCLNIAPNEIKKTCRDIGKRKTFANNLKNDPALKLYYKVYKRKSMMKSRYPDIEQYNLDFKKYSKVGSEKIKKYKLNKLTSEELIHWINKNS